MKQRCPARRPGVLTADGWWTAVYVRWIGSLKESISRIRASDHFRTWHVNHSGWHRCSCLAASPAAVGNEPTRVRAGWGTFSSSHTELVSDSILFYPKLLIRKVMSIVYVRKCALLWLTRFIKKKKSFIFREEWSKPYQPKEVFFF